MPEQYPIFKIQYHSSTLRSWTTPNTMAFVADDSEENARKTLEESFHEDWGMEIEEIFKTKFYTSEKGVIDAGAYEHLK